MNRQSTLPVTLSLLLGIAIATSISGVMGFKVGSFALEGVTQPEVNPTQKLSRRKNNADDPQSFKALNEKNIIDQINQDIKNKGKTIKPKAKETPNSTETPNPDAKTAEEAKKLPLKTTFPLSNQSEGITLTVDKATPKENSLILSVNLKNESAKPVQFLYSFLEIKDEEDRTLSGIAEGLPEKIPAHSQPFNGQIKIPLDLVKDNKSITLSLSNYPDQTINLSIKDIPIPPP